MDPYQSESEQLESVRTWWKENGSAVITGAALGIAVLFGWRAWQSYTHGQAELASAEYQQLVSALAQSDREAAEQRAGHIVKEYASTAYADLSALTQARLRVEQGDLDGAVEALQWVIDHGKTKEIGAIARERLARVHFQNDDYDEALKLLEGKPAPAGFEGLYAELRGDIRAAKGEPERAAEAYREALRHVADNLISRRVLEVKLADLGVTVEAQTQP